MRIPHLCVLTVAALAAPAVAMAATEVNVAPFHAVGLSDGGEVVIRAGAAPRVTLVSGDQQHTRFTVENGSLKIENCVTQCPHGYRLKVEIVMPTVTALAVSDGGIVKTEGAFGAHRAIAAAVSDGGVVDARSLAAANVTAAVNQGGSVMVTANSSLTAAVNSGGSIKFWGHPQSVTKAIHDGGAITAAESAALPALGAVASNTQVETDVQTNDSDDEDADSNDNGDEDMDESGNDGEDMDDSGDGEDMNDGDEAGDDMDNEGDDEGDDSDDSGDDSEGPGGD